MTYATAPRPDPAAMTDAQEYRLLFATTFVIFLVAVVFMRLVRLAGGVAPASSPRSLIAEARAVGNSALALAFQG